MDRQARIATIFRAALDLDEGAREAFVAAECDGDIALADEVRVLLASLETGDSPLDRAPAARLGLGETLASAAPPERIGPFRRVRLLGRGGMGEVWLAERVDGGFAQQAALKWVDRTRLGREGLERFARERALLAQVDHPVIARLIDGGELDGTPWFAMEYVDGVPLDAHLRETRPDLPAAIELLLPVIDAVQHLHRHLIVHRDLKPSNVLVDRDGRPRLIDLGIAKALGDEAARTEAIAPMSLAYAAPEQVAGEPITVATDVWGLGALLHEVLSGRSPHEAAASSLPRLVDAIARGTPTLPSAALALDPAARPWRPAQLRGDLDLIVATCLRREPERRYASAAAVGEDLRRWRGRLPIAARRDSLGYRARRFVARHPLGSALAVVAFVALAATTGYALREAERAEAAARAAARERDAARDEARRQEALREHFAAVIGRATASGEPIAPDALLDLVADPELTRAAHDPATHRALVLALADALVIRADIRRLAVLLDAAGPAMAGASDRELALFHKHRAIAGLRLGDAALAEDGIERATAAIGRAGLERSLIAADVLGYRAQRARAAGDFAAAVAHSSEAAAIARKDAEAGALDRGTVLANHGVTLLQAGDPDAAIDAIDEAEAIWSAGGVESNANAASARAVRANARLAAGDPAAALAEFDAIEAAAPPGDPVPAKASRQLARARALAWLGRADDAATESERAVARMCAALGAGSGDCRRLKGGRVEILAIAGRHEAALAAAEDLGDPGAWPPGVRAAAALARLAGGDAGSGAILAADARDAPASDRGRARAAARFALLGARLARRTGDGALARTLLGAAQAALDRAEAADGFDRPWLAVERARVSGTAPPAEALDALRGLGLAHLAD
jgi:tetratricopeptide (TPR) repeat protein/predicted Ser/Thr protein kinase